MLERTFERLLFASRWLLAPVYLALSLAMIALSIKFFQESFHLLTHIMEIGEGEMVLAVLSLIDMVLVSSLIVMVMLSGYENFVSRLDVGDSSEKLGWLGKLDSGGLKLKVAASIVAISSIHLLRVFMELKSTPDNKLLWYVIMHLTFVISAVLLALLDKIAFAGHREDHA
jgi:uncharacterized protein (TIGR00645 family)